MRYVVHQGCAPIPQVRSLGRAAALLVVRGEVTLLFHHRRDRLRKQIHPRLGTKRRAGSDARAYCENWSGNKRTRSLLQPEDLNLLALRLADETVSFTTDPVKLELGE